MTSHVNVILAVSDYSLLGEIAAADARVQDVVSRGDSDYITLSKAQIFHNALLDPPLATLGEVMIDKKRLSFVGILQEQHEAPLKRFNKFQARFTTTVHLIIDNYCIEGTVYLPTETRNVAQIVNRVSNHFFAVRHATVSAALGKRFKFPLVLVNHRRATVIGVPVPTNSQPQEPSQTLPTNVEISDDAVLRECEEIQRLVDHHDRGCDAVDDSQSVQSKAT
jgi:hypothetical protein